jgi:hypothetical protein
MKKGIVGLMVAILCASIAGAVERPGTLIATMKTASMVSQDQLAKAVEAYIAEIQKEKGAFVLNDDKTDLPLTLTQDKILREEATLLEANRYCVPGVFKGIDGKSYEIDFVLKPSLISKEIKVADAYIHKVDGVERYQWTQEKNEWKRESATKM